MFLETRKNNTTIWQNWICLPWWNLPAFSAKQSFTTYLFCLTHSFPSWTCLSHSFFFPSRKQKHPCAIHFFCLKKYLQWHRLLRSIQFHLFIHCGLCFTLKTFTLLKWAICVYIFFIGKHNTIHSTYGQLFNVIPKFVELK